MIILLIAAGLMIAQQGSAVFDDLVNNLVEHLIAGNAAGIIQVVAGPEHTLILSGTPEAETDEFDIYRRLPGEGFKSFQRLGSVAADSIDRQLREDIEGALQPGDILIPQGSRSTLTLRIAPSGVMSDRASEFLGRVIRTRLERSGIFQVKDLPGSTDKEKMILSGLPDVRQQLRDHHIDAAINLIMLRDAGGLTIVYQVISTNPDEDDLFSFRSEINAEFAVLLQTGTDKEKTIGGGSELIVSAPLSQDVLALAAVNADGQEGEELAVLLPHKVQLFRLFNGRLQLYSSISLDSIPAAKYPTRLPVGRLFAADFDDDGKRELLASSNLWAVGCIVDFDEDAKVSPLDYQPIAVIGNGENLHVFSGTYRSGEDTYSELVRILNRRGQTIRQSLFENLRSLYRLDDAGDRMIILHDNWKANLWDRQSDETVLTPLGIGRLLALATSGNKAVLAFNSKRDLGSSSENAGKPNGQGIMVCIEDPVNVEQGRTFNLSDALDILDITVYNSPAFPVGALAFLVKDKVGSISLDLYSWPE